MYIVRKQYLIDSIADSWDDQYINSQDSDKKDKGAKLRLLKDKNEDNICEMIGNSSWTTNYCSECGQDNDITIILGVDPTISVCPDCLQKAFELSSDTLDTLNYTTKNTTQDEQISNIVDKYLGRLPKDLNCKNWVVMKQQMVKEIKDLNIENDKRVF